MNKVIEKHELIEIAATLFRMKGYSGTSIDDIAKACRLTKGSLYHHFSGKEELAIAALDQVRGHFREHIFSVVRECGEPGTKELRAFNRAVEEFFTEHPHGCLLANLSMEMDGAFELFGKTITRFFDDWTDCYARVFARYYTPAKAKARAEDAVAIVQGCILMNRIRRDIAPLRRQHAALLESCKEREAFR